MISPVRLDDQEVAPTEPPAEPTRLRSFALVSAELRAALTMLTRLPIRGDTGGRTGATAFGVVGGLLGLAGLVPLVGLGTSAAPIAAILGVAVIAVASGAVHLDGLADTADALMAVGPDGAERARTDPAVGVGGVIAIVLVLGVDATSLAILVFAAGPAMAGVACVVAGAVSRVVPVVLIRLARARTAATGLGSWFASRTTNGAAAVAAGTALGVCLVAALVLGSPMVGVAGGIGGLGGLGLGLGLLRTRGQLDGDVLGASVELSFALTVLVAALGSAA